MQQNRWKIILTLVLIGLLITVVMLSRTTEPIVARHHEQNESSRPIEATDEHRHEHAHEHQGDAEIYREGLIAEQFSSERIDSLSEVPIHAWQTERVNNISQEDVTQSIDNLANFDDLHLAETGVQGLRAGESSTAFATRYIPNLFRVRKIMLEMPRNKRRAIPLLLAILQESAGQWDRIVAEKNEAHAAVRLTGKPYVLHEQDTYGKMQVQVTASMYILAESQVYQALPLFEDYLEMGLRRKIQSSPSPPGFVLLASHRLISSYPEHLLNSNAVRAQQAYMNEASRLIGSFEIRQVSRWDAPYDESDPRIALMDPNGNVLTDVPAMEMAYYPSSLTNGQMVADGNGIFSDSGESLAKLQLEFIRSLSGGTP